MLLVVANVLDDMLKAELERDLTRMPFADGAQTAGWVAQSVKRNEQAVSDPLTDLWRTRLADVVGDNVTVRRAAHPRRIIGPLISRYSPGDGYGVHIDDAILDGARADLAFTLFLSPMDSYDGGALVIDGPGGEEAFRLPFGSLLLYPATTLHRVETVTRGIRHAAAGWIRSYIRHAEQREIMFDLERARHALFDRHGKTPEFDLLSKTAVNLMRLWAED